MFVTAIIAAGGRGERLGGALPKQLLAIGGRAILERSVAAFLAHPDVAEIVVALPAALAADPPPYLRSTSKPLKIVAGGPRRQDSVSNALQAASDRADVVVIHDAARPFASGGLIAKTIAAAIESGAAVAAVAARDTVKRTERVAPAAAAAGGAPDDLRYVRDTLPRDTIYLAQTPQAFRREVLRDALALARAGQDVTDEATLAERAGHTVRLVAGEESNIKITTADDLTIAEAIARRFAPHPMPSPCLHRIGTGYDLHRLVADRPLMLGGIEVPSPVGPLGHSDGDVVCHAAVDAILGAAALGDIGRHFPDTDPQWKGASGLDLLGRAATLVAERGFHIVNLDVTVVLEKPKVNEHIAAMRTALAGALRINAANISLKGKTNEGVDAVGRGEAIAAHAVAMLTQSAIGN